MERVLMGMAIANPHLTAADYIVFLERLQVTVEPGARLILGDMPDNHRFNRCQVFEARRAPADPANMELVEIAQAVMGEFGCGVIAPHLVPVACTEIVRQWQGQPDYRHVVMFHQPVYVGGEPSILHFRKEADGSIVLGHTGARGTWHMPESLFACSMPLPER